MVPVAPAAGVTRRRSDRMITGKFRTLRWMSGWPTHRPSSGRYGATVIALSWVYIPAGSGSGGTTASAWTPGYFQYGSGA